ncbi:ABC transporter permease [Microvirga pudoricolor]|uniref:ABC transporter permease n=1 Tax=Microvirga pudoricolor TaxID=2778729 RepID=UPI00195009C8|nr:ABC transporter permease [Microvirga pudoricolor]MBM6596366.1 ABC transporter permease [Microvirga pudoricolor]
MLIDFDPVSVNTRQRLLPPLSRLPDGSYAIFGTDQLGRDVLAQILVGARVSLGIAIASGLFAALVGAAVGIAAGWTGGSTGEAIMRVIDVQLSFPSILIAVFLAAFIPASILTVIVVLAVTRWAAIARLARAITLKVTSQSYVESALVSGLPTWRIITSCVLPNLAAPLLVLLTADLSLIILAEASLGYVGLGTPPSVPSWGRVIANGRNFLDNAWWISTIPGVAISLLVIAIGLTGELLRRHFARDGWTML